MKKITSVALGVALLAACNSFGKDAPKSNPFTEALMTVPAAELPVRAADLVAHAKSRDREATTINVVKAALSVNPAAAPSVVAAIARAVPAMAPVAAATAAAEQPKQAAAIAKAAAAAAPSKARKIVAAVCRAVPNEYRSIAVAVSQAVPDDSKAILAAVADALPGLKPSIQSVLAGYGGNVPSVADTLDQAARSSPVASASPSVPTIASSPAIAGGGAVAAPRARGPAIGPPYIPLSTTPTNVTPGTSGQVPTGGRNYAAP